MPRIPEGFHVVNLDHAIEREAGALRKRKQSAPIDDSEEAFWEHVALLAFNAYEQKTRRPGERRPPLYDPNDPWHGYARNDEPNDDELAELERDEWEELAAPAAANEAKDEGDMSKTEEAVLKAYTELASKIGFKPSPAVVAEMADIGGAYAVQQVCKALRDLGAKGVELPYVEQRLSKLAEARTRAALGGKAPPSPDSGVKLTKSSISRQARSEAPKPKAAARKPRKAAKPPIAPMIEEPGVLRVHGEELDIVKQALHARRAQLATELVQLDNIIAAAR